MISFCKIFYASFIELLVLFYFLYRYFMGSDPNVVYRDEITISKQQLSTFMNHPGLDIKLKSNIERILAKPETFYNIPLNMISPPVATESYAKSLSLLLQYSNMPYNDKVTIDETDLAPYIISPSK